jgi:hypothetical protein
MSLRAFSFLPPWNAAGAHEDARAEQVIRQSVWAVAAAPDRSAARGRTVLGSAVAVSGETLLAGWSGVSPACLRIARNVPSGMSPG